MKNTLKDLKKFKLSNLSAINAGNMSSTLDPKPTSWTCEKTVNGRTLEQDVKNADFLINHGWECYPVYG